MSKEVSRTLVIGPPDTSKPVRTLQWNPEINSYGSKEENDFINNLPIDNSEDSRRARAAQKINDLIDSCSSRGEITKPDTCKSCELRKCLLGHSESEETPGQVSRRSCAVCMIETHSLQDEFPGYNQGGPGIFSKAANFAKALGKHVANGMIHVSPEQKQVRLDKCRACVYFQSDITCGKCGCPLLAKTEWESESCPIGEW